MRYDAWPWKLASVVDPRLSQPDRDVIADEFLRACPGLLVIHTANNHE